MIGRRTKVSGRRSTALLAVAALTFGLAACSGSDSEPVSSSATDQAAASTPPPSTVEASTTTTSTPITSSTTTTSTTSSTTPTTTIDPQEAFADEVKAAFLEAEEAMKRALSNPSDPTLQEAAVAHLAGNERSFFVERIGERRVLNQILIPSSEVEPGFTFLTEPARVAPGADLVKFEVCELDSWVLAIADERGEIVEILNDAVASYQDTVYMRESDEGWRLEGKNRNSTTAGVACG